MIIYIQQSQITVHNLTAFSLNFKHLLLKCKALHLETLMPLFQYWASYFRHSAAALSAISVKNPHFGRTNSSTMWPRWWICWHSPDSTAECDPNALSSQAQWRNFDSTCCFSALKDAFVFLSFQLVICSKRNIRRIEQRASCYLSLFGQWIYLNNCKSSAVGR